MNIRSKINSLFLLTALLAGCLLTLYVAQRDYHSAYDTLVDQAQAKILSHPELQLAIYAENVPRLSQVLETLSELPAIASAAAYNSTSELLASTEPGDSALPGLATVRGHAAIADTAVLALSAAGEPTKTGFWSALIAPGSQIHFTAPVISTVNLAQRGLTAVDFYESLNQPGENSSLRVMGYIHLVIDESELLRNVVPAVMQLLIGYLLLVAAAAVAVFLVTRHITAPLSQLKVLADGIATGELTQELQLGKNSEFKEIANVLNSVISNVNAYKNEADVDRKLLAMKVDESKSKLTQRDEELDKATRQVNVARDHLQKLAYYDSLTSLPNRTLFSDQLRLLLKMNEREQKPLALLFLDLKNFRRINDSLGHKTGDAVLTEVSKRLTGCLRKSDMLTHNVEAGPRIDVSRLGDDEFSIVLNRLEHTQSAALVAQRVVRALATPIEVAGHELVVTPSIGIAVAPRDANDVDGLVRAASIARNRARTAPAEEVLFYQDEMDAASHGVFQLEGELRKAIQSEQFTLHYQPQVNTTDGSIVCAEALLRWEHPEFGEVPPFRFIPVAEEIGLIGELGNWVLQEACSQLRAFRDQGLELPRIAINISPIQFNHAFAERVKNTLLDSGLSPDSLELGLAEGILMNNNSETVRLLEGLRRQGVHLSLDDFGISSTPLNYFSRFPLDELKIDRNIVSDCDTNRDKAKLVKTIIAIAGTLNLRTVAEGVESPGEYHFLADNGVRAMQGYLFSKPVSSQELQQQLATPWFYMPRIQQIRLSEDQSGS